jgi:hypothetical protein
VQETRVPQASQEADLAQEDLARHGVRGVEDLQSHRALQQRLPGTKEAFHDAAPEDRELPQAALDTRLTVEVGRASGGGR